MERRLGVLFTGGEGPGPQTIRRLLQPPPGFTGVVTVAADSGLALAQDACVEPEWIVGDMDSPGTEERLRRFNPERVIRYNTDKDYTDTELAFDLLLKKGCPVIWVIGGGGGRTDHLFGIRDLFERGVPPRRWITASDDIHCVDGEGEAGVLEAAVEPGGLVSVFPLGTGPWKAESRGLKWPLDNVRWERGFYGLSNVAVTGDIVINAMRGRFMIVFPGVTI